MSFLDQIKGLFDKGGIRVRLAVPKDFTWGDPTIPVTVTLTGHKSEPRTVASLAFTLEDVMGDGRDRDDGQSDFGRRVRIMWERPGAIELAAGQTVTVDVPVEIRSQEHEAAAREVRESIEDTKVGRFLGAASKMGMSFGVMSDPSEIRRYRITVHAPVKGVKQVASHARELRQGGVFKVSKPKFSL